MVSGTYNVEMVNGTCDALDLAKLRAFTNDVFGYSFLYQKWDPVYEFGKMSNSKLLHRFGTFTYVNSIFY